MFVPDEDTESESPLEECSSRSMSASRETSRSFDSRSEMLLALFLVGEVELEGIPEGEAWMAA